MSPPCGRDARSTPFPRTTLGPGLAPSPTANSLQQLQEDLRTARSLVLPHSPLVSIINYRPTASPSTATLQATDTSPDEPTTASATPSSSTESELPTYFFSPSPSSPAPFVTTSHPTPTIVFAPQRVSVRPMSQANSQSLPPSTATLLEPSSPAAPLDGPPEFHFTSIPFMDPCTPGTIRWTYSGPLDERITLLISPIDAPDLRSDPLEFMPVPSGVVDAALESFMWEPAGFAPGWYILQALGAEFGADSLPFSIGECDPLSSSPFSAPTPSPSSQLPLATGSHLAFLTTTFDAPSDAPSVAPQTLSASTQGSNHAAVMAGAIIIAVTILILIVLAFLCFRTALCRRSRPLPPVLPRDNRPYQSARWIGLSSSRSSLQPQDPAPPGVRESVKPRLSVIEMPRQALPRLEPNRRQPSMYIPSPVATSTPAPSTYSSTTKRGDSPTSLASPYKTRKPVPPLDLLEDAGVQGFASTGGMSPEITSPVPSSATSKMYRTRDSGMSLQTQSASEREEASRARASSIIDPHQFGAMKTMHSVVPDVPPLPQM